MKKTILSLLLLLCPLLGNAELVVVTGKNSAVNSLSENEVRQLFSGQLRSLGGQRVQAVDLPSSSKEREAFYQKLLGRTPEQMRAYWTRLIFTGQGQPPREVSGTQELTTLVGSSGDFIGYLPAEAAGANVKVLYRIR
jgi:ABC-type phosphate transport system substrate-binding protein